MYELSLGGASKDNPGIYAAEDLYNRSWMQKGVWQTLGLAGMHDSCVPFCWPQPLPSPFGPPPICKKIHAEATLPAWRTTSFAFTEEASFGWFTKLVSAANRNLVTQLTLLDKGFRYSHQWDNWHASFTPTTLAALPSLQGIHLVLNESVWFPSRGLPPSLRPALSAIDILHTFPSAHAHIPGLIRLLRQCRLRPERTTVFLPQSFLYRPPEVEREVARGFIPGTKGFVPRDDPHARWLCKPWRWHLDAGEMVGIAREIRGALLGGGEEGEREGESGEWGTGTPNFTGDNFAVWGRY